MDIQQHVDGSTPEPTDTTQLSTCTCNDFTAKATIMTLLYHHFIYLASITTTVQDAWKAAENHRHLPKSSTLHHTVQPFFSTKIQDTDVLPDNIYSHERKHYYTSERKQHANNQALY